MRISTIVGIKMAHLSWTKIFWYKPLLLLSFTYWPFSLCKIYKNSYSGSRITMMHHFWAQNGPFALKNFFGKLLRSFSSTFSTFHCAKFKKDSSSRSRIMRMCNFWAQNGPFPQMRIFSENLFMSLVSFIHAYLYVKNQNQLLIY